MIPLISSKLAFALGVALDQAAEFATGDRSDLSV